MRIPESAIIDLENGFNAILRAWAGVSSLARDKKPIRQNHVGEWVFGENFNRVRTDAQTVFIQYFVPWAVRVVEVFDLWDNLKDTPDIKVRRPVPLSNYSDEIDELNGLTQTNNTVEAGLRIIFWAMTVKGWAHVHRSWAHVERIENWLTRLVKTGDCGGYQLVDFFPWVGAAFDDLIETARMAGKVCLDDAVDKGDATPPETAAPLQAAASAEGKPTSTNGGDGGGDEKRPDGPAPGSAFHFIGHTYHIPPIPWNVLSILWKNEQPTRNDTLIAKIWGDNFDPSDYADALRSAKAKLNVFFKQHQLPFIVRAGETPCYKSSVLNRTTKT